MPGRANAGSDPCYLLTILLVFSLGLLLEGVQYFLPTRAGSFVDLGYNLVGVVAGVGVVWSWKTLNRTLIKSDER
ncbi:MAG: hypothetical protein RQ722_13185 [Desulfuromonadales bacterium]|nr:hypothetical protein [Desulfuromonadales bacterium]